MWSESGSASEDFTRVVALVRSQYVSFFVPYWLEVYECIRIKVALRSENVRPWHEVQHDFNEEYRFVRDRQMRELELEDDLLSKIPVR